MITQFQRKDKMFKSVKVLIIYNALTFSTTERKYQTYKWKLCAMIRFTIKFQYLLQNSDYSGIIYTDYKLLVYFLKLSLHNSIYEH